MEQKKSGVNLYDVANEILKKTTPVLNVVSIIDHYARQYNGSKEMYYVELLEALYFAKGYSNTLSYVPDKRIIRSEISGVLLYKKEDTTEWEPLFIVGKTNVDVEEIIVKLDSLLTGKTNEVKKSTFEKFNNELINEKKTSIVLRNKYKNPTIFPLVRFEYEVGDKVGKNMVIGVIDYYDYTKMGYTLVAKREVAESYCQEKIAELNPRSTKKQRTRFVKKDIKDKKNLNLYDIWQGPDAQYDDLFNLLLKEYAEINSGFIEFEGFKRIKSDYENIKGIKPPFPQFELDSPNTINGNRIFWCEEPKKGWQMYLAGMFFVLDLYDFIDKKKISGYTFVDICKNTFSMKNLGYEAFNAMKRGEIDNKYIKEFESRIKSVL